MNTTKYKYRLVARITVEATSPLAVGSGDRDIITDAPVARDVNGLPYIPGSSLAGVIRHSLDDKPWTKDLFGFQNNKDGEGSKIIVSDAVLVGEDGKAVDGLQDRSESQYLNMFKMLPIRQHVCINDKGTALKHGKFDEEVVYAGTRFCFEMEIMAENEEKEQMEDILHTISSPAFRLGSGTRNGFGAVKPVRIQYASYNLTQKDDLHAYINKSACLSDDWNTPDVTEIEPDTQDGWIRYTLRLKPTDFFLFSSGFGDDDADMTPVKEQHVVWQSNSPTMSEEYFLIPATSVKGAVAHRTAYHWNRLNKRFVDKGEAVSYGKNPAVTALFGTTTDEGDIKPQRGNAIFSDVTVKDIGEKVMFHIKIDKFTGSVQDGALFQEKVSNAKGQEIVEDILVAKKALADPTIKEAFEKALNDICTGMLPLGGSTNRGNGTFTGTLTRKE